MFQDRLQNPGVEYLPMENLILCTVFGFHLRQQLIQKFRYPRVIEGFLGRQLAHRFGQPSRIYLLQPNQLILRDALLGGFFAVYSPPKKQLLQIRGRQFRNPFSWLVF